MKRPGVFALAFSLLAAEFASVALAEMRQWIDSTGKFHVQAEFVTQADGRVELKLSDGTTIKVAINRFSELDREYVADKIRLHSGSLDAEVKAADELLIQHIKVAPANPNPVSQSVTPSQTSQATNPPEAHVTVNKPILQPAIDPQVDAERFLGIKHGRTKDIAYSYAYQGFFVSGVSTFAFAVTPIQLSNDGRHVLVELQGIRRYWNNKLQEDHLTAMPFTDPRGYKTYCSPPDWGDSVAIGDQAWISTSTAKSGKGAAGSVRDTGKADAVVMGVVGAAVAASELAKTNDSNPSESAADASDKLGPGAIVCNRGFLSRWRGRVIEIEGDSVLVKITYAIDSSPYSRGESIKFPRSQVKLKGWYSINEVIDPIRRMSQ